jgi:hypothetical protein
MVEDQTNACIGHRWWRHKAFARGLDVSGPVFSAELGFPAVLKRECQREFLGDATTSGPMASFPSGEGFRRRLLLQIARDFVERVLHLAAQKGDRGDDRHRDQRSDETIFDRRRARFRSRSFPNLAAGRQIIGRHLHLPTGTYPERLLNTLRRARRNN